MDNPEDIWHEKSGGQPDIRIKQCTGCCDFGRCVDRSRYYYGNGERLLNDDVLNGTVVMILFTCIISSVVTERAARKMVTQEI